MREIIFKDTGPRLVFSSTGELKQLRTGSDSFAEHNDAAEYLLPKLCTGHSAKATVMDVQPVTQRELMQFHTLPPLGTNSEEAVMGFTGAGGAWFTGERLPLNHPSMLANLKSFHDDVAAALAWGNFAIRVRGAVYVEALSQFHAAVLTGDVVLATGTRFNANPHGVALLNLKALTSDELSLLTKDPGEYLRVNFKN